MNIWRRRTVDQLRHIADENFQRTVWFGGGRGRWVDSPTETICSYDDLLLPRILAKPDHGLDAEQVGQLSRLERLMDNLVENTPDSIRPEDLIDDPRSQEIRKQAVVTLAVLSKDDAASSP